MVSDSDTGFKILNDNELIENWRKKSIEKDDDLNVEIEMGIGPPARVVFAGKVTPLKWMHESDHIRLLTVKRVRCETSLLQNRRRPSDQLTLAKLFGQN